ncbi:alpha-1,3-mannosyl-glycoprotein 4-beta-N-acetylglucosaminyltransferase B [Aplysia californica]|uniref:Alpha-1,3-mannosyl-glycoprotein 4-beta-N-acetylglucosaminyltransferase B n=1 Tax=Aplysia californica TaxID=6500 RepID=A0ABM1W3R6_APLCA|nr:alpha-1,3-mannosyl-glycoprotein 4-beta-N-acetylglucosaminyltransferase B [Aplysia californica]
MRVIQFPRRKILSLVFVFSVVLLILGINQVFVPAKQDEPDIFENNEQVAAFNSRDVESVLTPNALELARAGGLRVNQPDLPGVFTYLPHIAQRPEVLIPKYNVSQGRTGVKFVIGIPSIKRPVDVYVYNTVGSLLDAMTESEKQQTLILVCIAEPWNDQYAQEVLSTFKKRFPIEISQGILEVFSPKPEFYPNLARLKLTLGDAKERVRWRSKQNLDYAFLMLHAWTRGEYYIQLEDDLSAQKGFITSMSNTINKQYGEWFLLQFSTLGFIGRLFKCSDVPKIMEFLLMFYNQKPCDWLLDDYLRVQSCGHGENWKKCILKIQKIARPIEPSLFQHEGLHSSLQGTVNKLKDKSYGINQTSIHRNPSIENIISTIKQYSKYDIFSAYMGQDVFWGANPKAGDLVDFLFHPPIPISRYRYEMFAIVLN